MLSDNAQIRELKDLLLINERRLQAARTNVAHPRVLEESIAALNSQIAELSAKRDAKEHKLVHAEDILSDLLDRQKELQNQLRVLIHKSKIEQLRRLKEKVDAAS